jgi:hypothetical protein
MLDRSSIIVIVVCSGVGTHPEILPDRLFGFSTRAPSLQLCRRAGDLIGFPSLAYSYHQRLYSHLVYRIPYPIALLLVLNCFMWY